jgi:glyoxylase-like metal-dependent hydrolase (beta-lactamase superfamily II)
MNEFRNLAIGFLAAATMALLPIKAFSLEAAGVLKRASDAMGATDLRSLRYVGSGSGALFGLAFKSGAAWPVINLPRYVRSINYETASYSEETTATRAELRGGGGGLPPFGQAGERRTNIFVGGPFAWNMAGTTTNPAALFATERVHELWITPHGAIKAAIRNNATLEWKVQGGKSLAAVSFAEPGRFTATVYINDKYLVEKVESRLPVPVLGETTVVTNYSSYQSFGPIMFPMQIRQTAGGHMVLNITVRETQPNTAVNIAVPESVKAPPPQRVTTEKVAEGVWFVAGGSHNSVAIEMKDQMLLVEAPNSDGRMDAVLEAVGKLVPGKAVRTVVNTLNHFDHAGGLRAAAAAGATIITQAQNKEYLERAFATRASISPDNLTKSGKKARVRGVGEKLVLGEGERTVELHRIRGSTHNDAFLMAWLPNEKLLIEADAFNAAPKPPAQVNPLTLNLVENIERLKLPVERILPMHGGVVPVAALYAAIGRKP